MPLAVVVPYSLTWPSEFASISTTLSSRLGSIPHAIEHVGSTSVPGLPAKAVIDIDIIVSPQHLPAAIEALKAAGYDHLGDWGVPGREVVKDPSLPREPGPGEPIRRNIYVCLAGCTSLKNHLAVRDVLRANAGLRDEYGRVKMDLARRGLDVDTYCRMKSGVIQKVLRAAPHGVFSDEELRGILDVNEKGSRHDRGASSL